MAAGDVLPVIVFALLFGLFVTRLNGPNVDAVQRLVDGVLEVIQALTLAIVKLAPVGIFALLAREVARSGPGIIWDLRYYFVTVGVGLLIHATVTLPIILFTLGGRNPAAVRAWDGAGRCNRLLHRLVVGDPAFEHGLLGKGRKPSRCDQLRAASRGHGQHGWHRPL